MSLTSHLSDLRSPVRAFLDGVSPRLAGTRGRAGGARTIADELGLTGLVELETSVAPFGNADPRLSGTALDFRARIELGGFNARLSEAATGIDRLPTVTAFVENGVHRRRILSEAFDVAERLLADPNDVDSLDRASILLAHCEQVERAGRKVFEGSVGEACDAATSGEDFAWNISTSAIIDVRSMLESNRHQLGAWRAQIDAGERYAPNPKFAGSALVGGADGDWLIGDMLIDCKAYEHLTVPKLRDFLRQLLGYVMLDLDDALGIRRVGIWLPRQRVMPTWSLSHLLSGDPEELLPKLRAGFARAAGGKQVASYVPVSDRRKRLILADNWQTPPHMLTALACDEDEGIRWRVGRNPTTPVMMLGLLAEDPAWRVREAVASNENTPELVLNVLSNDRSVVVRRAVEANPSAPLPSTRALTSDRAEDRTPPAETATKDVVVLAPVPGNFHISQERDYSLMTESWFVSLIEAISRGDAATAALAIAPRESVRWAKNLKRSFVRPAGFESGLPREVALDLMRTDRPANVRRVAAQSLLIADPTDPSALLSDPDPEIRWAALKRSVDVSDSSLSELLGDLATSRKSRTHFRTDGMEETTWGRPHTPRQYDQQVLESVARHPATPASALDTFSDATSPGMLASLLENQSLPPAMFETIVARMKSDRRVQIRTLLAAASTLPGAVADELAGDSNVDVRTALARNPAASPSSLRRLVACDEISVQQAIIDNPSTPIDVGAALAVTMLEGVEGPPLRGVLDTVARRPEYDVPVGLVQDALDRLLRGRTLENDMSLFVARDVRTSAATLVRLAEDDNHTVRRSVAGNTGAPREAIRRLLWDEDPFIRRRARENPSAFKEDIELAHEPKRPRPAPPTREAFHEMAASRLAKDRLRAAQNVGVPPDVLALLGGDPRSVHVRRAAAAHPSTPAATLRSLAEDKDDEIRRSVALNSATPPDVLAELAGQRIDLALLVAINPGAAAGIVDALAQDRDPLISYFSSAARNARRAIEACSDSPAQLTGGA